MKNPPIERSFPLLVMWWFPSHVWLLKGPSRMHGWTHELRCLRRPRAAEFFSLRGCRNWGSNGIANLIIPWPHTLLYGVVLGHPSFSSLLQVIWLWAIWSHINPMRHHMPNQNIATTGPIESNSGPQDLKGRSVRCLAQGLSLLHWWSRLHSMHLRLADTWDAQHGLIMMNRAACTVSGHTDKGAYVHVQHVLHVIILYKMYFIKLL